MARLRDVCSIRSSNHAADKEKNWLLNLDVVEQQTGKVLEYNYVPENGLGGSIVSFDTDNVLYSKLRPNLNKVVIPEKEGYATSEMLPLYPDEKQITREYLACYLRSPSFVDWAVSKTAGAKMPRLGTKELLNKEISLPAVDLQKKITEALFLIDSLIFLRKKQLQKLDDLVKSRFVEMFGDPIHPTGFYALGEVATLERGRFSPRPRNDPKYYNGDYPFIQTGDIASCNHRLWNYTQTLNELGIKVSKKFDTGTIVMAIVGATIGATAILQREVYAPDSVVGITPHTYNNIFLESLLQFWRPELLATAPESARANINLSILGSIPIVRANQSQQQAFSDFVFQIDKTKLTVQQGLDKLELLKQSLMQKYFG